MKDLDEKDCRLLYELDMDSRRSYQQLGRKLRLGKNTVRYRGEGLKKSGIIKGFHAMINYGLLGKIGFRIYLSLEDATPEKEKEMIAFLAAKNEVVWLASMDGRHNLGAFVIVENLKAMDDFWNEFLEKYISHIGERLITVLSSVYYFSAAYLSKSKKNTFMVGMSAIGKEDVGELDVAILHLLAGNAVMPLVEIAQKLKKTPKTILARMKSLEERKILLGYKCILDFEKLGYEHYRIAFDLFKLTWQRETHFREFSMQHPNIVSMERHIGGYDFEIALQVKNAAELRIILDELRKQFSDIIRSHQILHIYEEHKNTYLPIKE